VSRFDFDDEGEGVTWEMWQQTLSRALGGRRGQEALAAMEAALLELPEHKLIEGHLAADGGVCAVGAFVAHRQAEQEGADLQAVIETMSAGTLCWCGHDREAHPDGEEQCTGRKKWNPDGRCPCDCWDPYEADAVETAEAGQRAGLAFSVAWHFAYLNDEQFGVATPEERHERMLAWVRRAQGKAAA
jgi:hypothetical protein